MEDQVDGEHTPHLQAKYLGNPYKRIQETRRRGRHAGGNHRRYTLEVYTGVRRWRLGEQISSPLNTNKTGQ